jgi:signal transduction histidine kinase
LTQAGPHLLIVDDDPALGKTLRIILQKDGYTVDWVATGKEGVDLVRREALTGLLTGVLIDVKLPDMNGLQVLRVVKETNPDVGAIMMTGHTDVETAVGALNQGAFAYIQKPYNVDEVKAAIARLIEKQALVRENRVLLRQMAALNADLENRVDQRTRELQAANLKLADTIEKLREAISAKSEFVSMVSHELRTPLTVILGFVQTCLNQMDRAEKNTLRHYMEIIHAHGLMLSKLIESILDLSRIREKGLDLFYETFDLRSLTQAVVESLGILKPGLRFDVFVDDESRQVVSDKDRVRQVLMNLLANAIKYSPDKAAVRVEGRAKDGVVEVSVADAGPGIAPGEQVRLFEPFYRAKDPINHRTPGTGLGLAVSKAIVEGLGGRIWVESEAGHGSRFVFTVPKDGNHGKP